MVHLRKDRSSRPRPWRRAAQNEDTMASLFDAASCGSIAATRRLLEARADVNQRKTVMRAASSCNARAPASACALAGV